MPAQHSSPPATRAAAGLALLLWLLPGDAASQPTAAEGLQQAPADKALPVRAKRSFFDALPEAAALATLVVRDHAGRPALAWSPVRLARTLGGAPPLRRPAGKAQLEWVFARPPALLLVAPEGALLLEHPPSALLGSPFSPTPQVPQAPKDVCATCPHFAYPTSEAGLPRGGVALLLGPKAAARLDAAKGRGQQGQDLHQEATGGAEPDCEVARTLLTADLDGDGQPDLVRVDATRRFVGKAEDAQPYACEGSATELFLFRGGRWWLAGQFGWGGPAVDGPAGF